MAMYYDAKEIAKKLENQLKICHWESIDDGEAFMIELPVVLYFNYQRLRLHILPVDDGYYVSDDGETFVEFSFDARHYYDLFCENDDSYKYEIELKDEKFIAKRYQYDYSLMSAIDEFVRFFIRLDEFMNKHDLT